MKKVVFWPVGFLANLWREILDTEYNPFHGMILILAVVVSAFATAVYFRDIGRPVLLGILLLAWLLGSLLRYTDEPWGDLGLWRIAAMLEAMAFGIWAASVGSLL